MDKMQDLSLYGDKGIRNERISLSITWEGYKVQGSDLEQYFFTQKDWKKLELHYYHLALTILKKDKLSLQGNAFPDSHEELVSAREKGRR